MLGIELAREGWPAPRGPSLFRLVLQFPSISSFASEISVWVERRRAPARRADAGKSLLKPPLQLIESRERLC